jgi:integrase
MQGEAVADGVSKVARIGKTVVDKAEPAAARYTIWDDKLGGFGLRISPAGAKTYIARYRTAGGRAGQLRQVTLGRHGQLTADQARDAADKVIAAATLGADPAADRAKVRADVTIAALCDLYFAEGCTTKKATTLYTDKGRSKRHILPLLGPKRAGSVTRADVERFLADVAGGKTAATQKTRPRGKAVVRGGRGAATRTVGLLGAIFTFAVSRGIRADNPVKGVRRFKDRKMERFLSDSEMASLGDALRAEAAAGGNAAAVNVIRLLIVTGCRKNEVQRLKWTEVDARLSCFRLKDSKSGPKVVPIGAPAVAILSKIPRGKSEFVFPAQGDDSIPFQGVDKTWRSIREAAGLPDVRLHDLRHTYASTGLLAGYSLPVLGKLLGHSDAATTQRYAHIADSPMKVAADTIAAAIEGAMTRGLMPANDNIALAPEESVGG